MTSTSPISGFSHLQLLVADVDASERWYSTALGLQRAVAGVSDGRPYVLLRHPATPMGIVLQTAPGSRGEQGIDHVAFAVPDRAALEAWVTHLDELGIDHPGIADVPEGASLVLADPDGIGVELLAPPAR